MSHPNEEQLSRDDLAERRRERDRQREPGVLFRRVGRSHVSRDQQIIRFQASLAAARLECPSCLGPVFAPGGSHGELVDCNACDARLVTHRTPAGEVTAILRGPQPAGGQ